MNFRDSLTTHRRSLLLFVLFFLISTVSFALGYLAHSQFAVPPIIIEQTERI